MTPVGYFYYNCIIKFSSNLIYILGFFIKFGNLQLILFNFHQKLAYRDHLVNVQSLCSTIGIPNVGALKATDLLARMSLTSKPISEEPQMVDIEKALRMLELAQHGEKIEVEKQPKQELIKVGNSGIYKAFTVEFHQYTKRIFLLKF